MTLDKDVQEILKRPNEERIAYIYKSHWIDYPIAKEIIAKLERLFTYEKGKSRISSMLLVGASNNGKSSLLQRFAMLHPPYDFTVDRPEEVENAFFDNHSGVAIPVLYMLAPSEPSETRLYSNILSTLNVAYKEKDTVYTKQYLVEYYLKLLHVDMLIIDEIHNLLSGSIAKQKQVLNAIKNLSNTLQIPIILAGTKDSLRAIGSDDQISSRFRPEYLTRWKMDKDYVSLLATILASLPLKKESNILNKESANIILEISNGYIGEIINLLRSAAVYAIESGSERITHKEIQECEFNSLSKVHRTMNLKDI